MSKPILPIGQLVRLAADAVVKAGPCNVLAVMGYGVQADWAVAFHNHASAATGDPVLDISGSDASGSKFFDFTNLGGVAFSVGCYANITVSSGFIYVWIE